MIQYLPIILICSTSVAPKDCNIETKQVSVFSSSPQNTPMACLVEGQTKVASLAISPKAGEPYYVKIRCEPKEVE